jgi:peptide/nickel transport system permease protein
MIPRSDNNALRRDVYWAVGPLLLVLLVASAYCALSHQDPGRLDLELSWSGPSLSRPLGSGEGGIDLLSFVAHATLQVLLLGAVVASVAFVTGTFLGALAGLIRGWFASALLRLCDLVQSFPSFLLALAVLSAVDTPRRWHLAVVFSISAWAPFARIALVQARALSAAQFVEAARACGASRLQVTLHHVIPNLLGPVAIQMGTAAAGVVLGETGLSFVGLGPADGVSLGALLEQGTLGMVRAPHVLAVGAIAIVVVSGSLQLASEGLRRSMDIA